MKSLSADTETSTAKECFEVSGGPTYCCGEPLGQPNPKVVGSNPAHATMRLAPDQLFYIRSGAFRLPKSDCFSPKYRQNYRHADAAVGFVELVDIGLHCAADAFSTSASMLHLSDD